MPPGTPDEIQPPAYPVQLQPPADAIHWREAWRCASIAGVVAGFISFLPILGIGFFLWALAAGAWAASAYIQRTSTGGSTRALGWRLGALTGLVSFCVYAVLFVFGILFFRTGPQLQQALQKAFEDAAARSGTPQSQQVLGWLLSPGGFAAIVTLVMVVFLVVFLVFGAIGGMLGASVLRPRQSR